MIRALAASLAALAFLPAAATAQPDAPAGAPVARYDGHRLVRVRIRSAADLQFLGALDLDPWSHNVSQGLADYRVPPELMPVLEQSGIPFEVLEHNLQAGIDAENARIRGGGAQRGDWFAEYKNPDAVSAYVDELAALRPDLATRILLGQSIQGRPIYGLRITNDAAPGQGQGCKPALLLNSVQHAREWITVMCNMYIADTLIRNYDTDASIRQLVDNVEFFIVPVTNPDGYAFTWTADRFWRKNRRNNPNGGFGVDLNRNWSVGWGIVQPDGRGGSSTQNSEVYWGTGPFSEPETQVLRDFTLAHPNIRSHNDIHSYGQLILWPWGHTPDLSPDDPTFAQIGAVMRQRILDVHGRAYDPGPTYSNIYPVSGGSVDWFYGAAGAFSFSYELRGPGFNPPPTEIRPNAEEVLPATLYQAEWIMQNFPFRADFTADCLYTLDDFVAYRNAYAAGDLAADLDGNGLLTLNDFVQFRNAYAAGR